MTEESLLMLPLAPEGTPYKMAAQEFAFNGDTFLAEEFLRLKEKHSIELVVETGTYIGTTTLWLAKHFQCVFTVEILGGLHGIAKGRIDEAGLSNAHAILGTGVDFLKLLRINDRRGGIFGIAKLPDEMGGCYVGDANWMLLADAHPIDGSGKGYDVVVQELVAVAESGLKPACIILHDFQVPDHPEFQFDKFDGKPFTFSWVKPQLDAIYGPWGYTHYFNSQATGAKVGCLFIERT